MYKRHTDKKPTWTKDIQTKNLHGQNTYTHKIYRDNRPTDKRHTRIKDIQGQKTYRDKRPTGTTDLQETFLYFYKSVSQI